MSISNDACQFIYGCMDPVAYNYDFEAGVDDGLVNMKIWL